MPSLGSPPKQGFGRNSLRDVDRPLAGPAWEPDRAVTARPRPPATCRAARVGPRPSSPDMRGLEAHSDPHIYNRQLGYARS
eukprot:366565-Chlamydomonas_euryale.AAC.13